MSQVSKKKLKQATLPFAVSSPSRKRKREDDSSLEEDPKSRKTCESTELSGTDTLKSRDTSLTFVDDEIRDNTSIDDEIRNNTSVDDEIHDAITEGSTEQLSNFEAVNNEKVETDVSLEQPHPSDVPDICDTLKIEVPALNESVSAMETSLSTVSQQSEVEKSENEIKSETTPTKPLNSSQLKKLTPKQVQRRKEAEARRLEREKVKQEKEQKRVEEKEAREKKRLAEIEAKNEEKRQKEEERKLKEEEKRKQREAEKKAREEERKCKEEEKLKKIEEMRLKEEQEKKKQEKTAANFMNFFVPKSKTNISKALIEDSNITVNTLFMPFEVKEDMKLAAIARVTLTPERKTYLEKVLVEDIVLDKNDLYLAKLKSKEYKPGHSENTWPLNQNDDEELRDGNLLESAVRTRYRRKLLQFSENRRPAYWGTWRKRSKLISGRTPFSCDSEFFEYEIDSDEEWVEEPGESLHGSGDEKESDHEYEVDNDFFVPHGYLSEEEAPQDGEINDQTTKLNLLQNEFEAELKEKTCKLKSRSYGCVWLGNEVQEGTTDVENLLLLFRGVYNRDKIPFRWKPAPENVLSSASVSNSPKTKLQSEFPEQFVPDFIRLLHGNKNSAKTLSSEFAAFVQSKKEDLSLGPTCVKRKLREIASWHLQKACWYVRDEVRQAHGLEKLSITENEWTYVTPGFNQPKKIRRINSIFTPF